MSAQKQRSISIGSWVRARREEDDDEWERCQVLKVDADAMQLNLRFDGGFVATGVPLSRVKLADDPDASAGGAVDEPRIVELPVDDGYAASVAVPAAPSDAALAADPEEKYRYVAAYKAAGNALFKEGKYAWAIRTYTDAVARLTRVCYPSRERMLWDYFARVPCAQCYSNAALCALKLGDYEHAETLCEHAMECRPEDADLTKVLLRHGQALLGQAAHERALPLLERAADKEPANRAVKEELLHARRAIRDKAKAADAGMFKHVDLAKAGLTSRRAAAEAGAGERLSRGFAKLLDAADAAAAAALEPLLESKLCAGLEGAAVRLAASYGAGVAHYHLVGAHCPPSNLPRGFQRFGFVNPFRAGGFSDLG